MNDDDNAAQKTKGRAQSEFGQKNQGQKVLRIFNQQKEKSSGCGRREKTSSAKTKGASPIWRKTSPARTSKSGRAIGCQKERRKIAQAPKCRRPIGRSGEKKGRKNTRRKETRSENSTCELLYRLANPPFDSDTLLFQKNARIDSRPEFCGQQRSCPLVPVVSVSNPCSPSTPTVVNTLPPPPPVTPPLELENTVHSFKLLHRDLLTLYTQFGQNLHQIDVLCKRDIGQSCSTRQGTSECAQSCLARQGTSECAQSSSTLEGTKISHPPTFPANKNGNDNNDDTLCGILRELRMLPTIYEQPNEEAKAALIQQKEQDEIDRENRAFVPTDSSLWWTPSIVDGSAAITPTTAATLAPGTVMSIDPWEEEEKKQEEEMLAFAAAEAGGGLSYFGN